MSSIDLINEKRRAMCIDHMSAALYDLYTERRYVYKNDPDVAWDQAHNEWIGWIQNIIVSSSGKAAEYTGVTKYYMTRAPKPIVLPWETIKKADE